MLFLMNRDEIIAVFEKKDSSYLLLGNKKEKMPIGFQTLENWLKRRNSASHNGYLYSLLEKCGCNNENEFLSLTHAASLNDTFWVSNGTELLGWDDVSPYRNSFSEPVSKLAFEGTGDFEEAVIISDSKDCFPDLSTEGQLPGNAGKEKAGKFSYTNRANPARGT